MELFRTPRLTMPPANNCQLVLVGDGSEPAFAVVACQYDPESNTASFLLYAVALFHGPELLMPTSPCGPCAPAAPGGPWGIKKVRSAAFGVPLFMTEAGVG